MTAAPITVLRDRAVPSPWSRNVARGPDGSALLPRDGVVGAPLDDAMRAEWPTDAHFQAFAPVVVDGMVLRLTTAAVDTPAVLAAAGGAFRMTALVGDVDGPDHVATPEWRAETERRLAASGLAHYSTRGGYRVLASIEFPIASRHDAAEWTRLVRGWHAHLRATYGIECDPSCIDWTRIFRLPNVLREGKPERAAVRGAALPWTPAEWRDPGPAASAPAATLTPLADLPPADRGIVASLGPWTAHTGRKWLLCGAIGGIMRRAGYRADECEAVIRAWLPEADSNVDADHGVTRALGAWNHDAGDVSGHDALAQLVGVQHADVIERAVDASSWAAAWLARWAENVPKARDAGASWLRPVDAGDPLGVLADLTVDDGPIPYVCAGLRLAPSLGKISLVGGLPGAGKGPFADYLAACFALGAPVCGAWPVERQPVLLLDVEGMRLTKRRTRRFARALGYDPAALRECLELRDVSRTAMMDDRFMYALEAHPARIVIVDSYTTAMLATDLDPFKNEYAQFARMLAALDRCVLVVAHARKPQSGHSGERPTLADIAGSGALGAMAQTAFSVWRPDDDEYNHVRVGCARAPEMGFETFDVRFEDTAGDGLAVNMITATQVQRVEAAARTADVTTAANAVLRWLVAHPVPHPRKAVREGVIVAGDLLTEHQMARVLAMLIEAKLVTAHAGIGSKLGTVEITSVQRTPAAVAVNEFGVVIPADPGEQFRRPAA